MVDNQIGLSEDLGEPGDGAMEAGSAHLIDVGDIPGIEAKPAESTPDQEHKVGEFAAAKALARLQAQATQGPEQARLAEEAGEAFQKQFGDQ